MMTMTTMSSRMQMVQELVEAGILTHSEALRTFGLNTVYIMCNVNHEMCGLYLGYAQALFGLKNKKQNEFYILPVYGY